MVFIAEMPNEDLMTELFNKIDQLQKRINAKRPLPKQSLIMLRDYYRVGFTYSSNAIEGNTLTETETKVIIEDGFTVSGKPLRDHYEAIGHSEAYDFLYSLVDGKSITEANIRELHRLFYFRIDNENAGKSRDIKIFISGTDYIPPEPENIHDLMREFVDSIPKLREEKHPVEFAAFLHKGIADIHPFVDGNGRTARLLMNLALLQEGFVITIIPPVRRLDYFNAIVRSQTKNDDGPFIKFIAEMLIESQKDYLRMLGDC